MVQITREDKDTLYAVLKINVGNDDYRSRVDKVIKDYSRNVDLKGFRKGKVPKGVITNMYGTQLLAEELNKIVNEELNKYLEENKIHILGQPLPLEAENIKLEIEEKLNYEFMYELGLAPEIKMKSLSSYKVKKFKIKLSDKDITEEIDRLRLRFGKMSNPDDIQEGDTLYVNFRENRENGLEHDTTILIDHIKDKSLKTNILAAAKESTFQIDIHKAFDKEPAEINKHYLGQEDGSSPDTTDFTLTIKNINRMGAADMDQNFFDQVYGPGVVKTVEEFNEKMDTEYGEYLNGQANNLLNTELRNTLLDAVKMKLPDEFLKRWIKATNGKPISDEQLDGEYDIFTKDLRWSLIFNHLVKTLELEVTPEELEARTRESIIEQFRMYNNQTVPAEKIDNFARELMKDKEHLKRTYEEIMNRKFFDSVRQQATIKEKETSLTEFNKEIKKHQ